MNEAVKSREQTAIQARHGSIRDNCDRSSDEKYDLWFRREVRAAIDSANAGNSITAVDVEAEFARRRKNTLKSARELDSKTELAARAFMARASNVYAVSEGIMFGSRARGDHRSDSDADIAVILEGEVGDRWEATRELSGIAFDVMLDTGILIQALPLWEEELRRPNLFSNPALIENIKREGVRL